MSVKCMRGVVTLVLGATLVAGLALGAADADPKVSTFAAIDDLLAEAEDLADKLDKSLTSAEQYTKDKRGVGRNANTLALVAYAVSQYDDKSSAKWSSAAAAVCSSARKLAAASDYAEAKSLGDNVKSYLNGGAPSGAVESLTWAEVVHIKDSMPILNYRNLQLRRGFRRPDPKSSRDATVIALIARAAREDAESVKDKNDLPKWHRYCDQLRDDFADVAQSLRSNDTKGAAAKHKVALKSCTDCHKDFRPDIDV